MNMDGMNMHCTNHPYNTTPAGGICGFCLQEKLGHLVSSSAAVFPSSPPPPPPPPPPPASQCGTATASTIIHHNDPPRPRPRPWSLPFLSIQRKKKKEEEIDIVVLDVDDDDDECRNSISSHRGGGFWSFLYLNKYSSSTSICTTASNATKFDKHLKRERNGETVVVPKLEKDEEKQKVWRSKSVGCGSRVFSTGLGDCGLRRVQSQREPSGNPKASTQRVNCGAIAIFTTFVLTSSSSSSSTTTTTAEAGPPAHRRSNSWGWPFIIAARREATSNNNTIRSQFQLRSS